jgi:hypothetical protein
MLLGRAKLTGGGSDERMDERVEQQKPKQRVQQGRQSVAEPQPGGGIIKGISKSIVIRHAAATPRRPAPRAGPPRVAVWWRARSSQARSLGGR